MLISQSPQSIRQLNQFGNNVACPGTLHYPFYTILPMLHHFTHCTLFPPFYSFLHNFTKFHDSVHAISLHTIFTILHHFHNLHNFHNFNKFWNYDLQLMLLPGLCRNPIRVQGIHFRYYFVSQFQFEIEELGLKLARFGLELNPFEYELVGMNLSLTLDWNSRNSSRV